MLLGTTQLLGVLPGAYLGPILSAFVVTAAADGRRGLRIWSARLVRWAAGWRWYVAVAVGVPAVLVVATLPLSGGGPRLPSAAVAAAYLPVLLLEMVTTGLAEEPGWRDLALPRLQRRHGPVAGTLILGPLWGAWHLPLFLSDRGGWPHVDRTMPVEFILAATAFSFVMTWVFNRTNESLPLAMLVHTSVNRFFSAAWPALFPTLGVRDVTHVLLLSSTVVAVVLLAATRDRLGLRRPPAMWTAPQPVPAGNDRHRPPVDR